MTDTVRDSPESLKFASWGALKDKGCLCLPFREYSGIGKEERRPILLASKYMDLNIHPFFSLGPGPANNT